MVKHILEVVISILEKNMRDFGSDNRSRGGRDFPRRSFGGRDSSNRSFSLHDAVCDECGKNCQVPFRPSGGKPIYCSDCFEKKVEEITIGQVGEILVGKIQVRLGQGQIIVLN